MSTQNDGGPAFPTKREYMHGAGTGYEQIDGMTLRDYFAGQALAGLMAAPDSRSCPRDAVEKGEKAIEQWRTTLRESDCAFCYLHADAMLAARERKGQP